MTVNKDIDAAAQERWLAARAAEAARGEGCDLLDLRLDRRGPRWRVELTVDRPQGVGVEDCARISRRLGARLDEADAIEHAYTLQVSSPGLTRPLVAPGDYDRFRGRLALVELHHPIEGRTRYRGLLEGLADDASAVRLHDRGLDRAVELPLDAIAWGRLDFDAPAAQPSTARGRRNRS